MVNPALAVSKAAEVIVPEPVVEMLAVVVMLPSAVIAPIPVIAPVVEISQSLLSIATVAELLPIVVTPVDESVVNAPDAAVVAPI
jgi:hypothetical protein